MTELAQAAVRRLQDLIRIDTTNPPGNETPAAEYLADWLTQEGIDVKLVGAEPRRMCVVARLKGSGEKAPLLLNAHLDVVPAEAEKWRFPPFAGEIHDGYLWGRGAIDMKHMAVMSALVMSRLKHEGVPLRRDLVFAGVADEEAGCDAGSRFLVEHHADLVRAEFALGEAGGATTYLGGRVIYPVQVAEKGVVWMRLHASGRPGHGSMPHGDSAILKLSSALARLGAARLPLHRTSAADAYLSVLSSAQPFPQSVLLRHLHKPWVADFVLSKLGNPAMAAAVRAILSNTAVPTIVRAGAKINTVPASAEADVDGRSLPGQSATDLVAEVQTVVGSDIRIEVLREMPPVEQPLESELWDLISHAIASHHPGAAAVPCLIPGFTDAKSWSRLGCRSYGFTPLRFPNDGVQFAALYHGHDERVPLEGLGWGVEVLHDVVRAFVVGPATIEARPR